MKNWMAAASLMFATSTSFAGTHDMLMEKHFQLNPNKAEVMANPVFWTVTLHCTMTTTDASNTLKAKVVKNKGKVNGIKLKKGDEISLNITNQQKVTIEASGSAKVEVTNLGKHTVTADCDVSL